MKMNDFIAQSYGNNQQEDKEKKSKNVEPAFKKAVFPTIKSNKSSNEQIQNSQIHSASDSSQKNVKPFTGWNNSFNNQAQSTQTVNSFEKTTFTDKSASSKKNASATSVQMENTMELLKNGGLLKVPVKEKTSDGKDSVYRRVAKFLLLLGEDEAAKILPHLSESQIEKIIPEIASIRTVSADEASVIMAEFKELLEKSKNSGGVETARDILERAYGKDRALQMMAKAMPLNTTKPFEYFDDADKERIYQLIQDENVGIQSLVLSNLEPKKAAEVINLMKPEEKKEVVLRLAKMESVSPEVLRRVDEAMHEKSLNHTTEKAELIDGRNALAQILKKMDFGTENDILNYLSDDDPDLGQDLRKRLFTIDDVINADDKFVQIRLHEMSEIDIAYMIAGKSDDFREKILSNISAGRRAEVREQEDILKPMRKSDCDRITAEFLAKLRKGFEQGNLIIKERNEDQFI